MKELAPIQKAHFRKMTHSERRDVIRDSERQLGTIAASSTVAAERKREELQAYIDFCRKLNRELW